MDPGPWTYVLLFLAAVAAGLVDSIAGGGGMITVPALMLAGLPPHAVLGTNKLQSSFGSFTATVNYAREGLVDLRQTVLGVALTFLAAAGGSLAALWLQPELLERVIPVLLVALVVYMLARPRLGHLDVHPRMHPWGFYLLFGSLIGFYDGFFGPGTGSFWALAFVLGLGQNLAKATAHTKVMNFTSNIAALLIFAVGGQVMYGLGLTMGAGQMFGAHVGSMLVVRRGARFVRPVFLVVAGITVVYLVIRTW